MTTKIGENGGGDKKTGSNYRLKECVRHVC